jgi:ABC-type bacteriocin/lantibiotic exporter with double-glycine peptidase domain
LPPTLLPIELRPQEAEAGCLAACAQMVLAGSGLALSQAELNRLFELTPAGVPLSRLRRLDRYGVKVAIHRHGDLPDLHRSIEQNTPPIIFIRTEALAYWSEDTQHAVVVSGYEGSDLWLNDPAFPAASQKVLAAELMLAWDEFDNAYALLTR